ncbi:MAG TPA: ROK family protein, partial [Candidatus Sumerlaeia bacterium]|nr:ROK family protein [Candidatus Sumerlaeia bacterium]
GPLCYCGKRGCLESVASDYALVAQAKDAIKDGVNTRILDFAGSKDNITAEAICHAAEDGDRLAYNMLERVGYFLAMGVANLLNVLGPEAVLFGGSMIEPNDVLLDCIQRNLRVYTLEYIEKHVKVAKATFGSNQGIQGAITIALNDCYTKPQAGNSIG